MTYRHSIEMRAVNAWDGTADEGAAVDPWEGNALTFHFAVRTLSSATQFAIECAPANPDNAMEPDNSRWAAVTMRAEPCDRASDEAALQVNIDPASHNGQVVSVDVPMCGECKFYRVRKVSGPADAGNEVRVIAEITHLRGPNQ